MEDIGVPVQGTLKRAMAKGSFERRNLMKKVLYLLFVLISVGLLSAAYAAESSMMHLKVGDEVFACNCGTECQCNMMATKAGSCTCGKAMVKAKVVRIEGSMAYLKADRWEKERPFKMTGKYVCACGPDCGCDAVSQQPGKCPCGMEMKKGDMMGKDTMMKKEMMDSGSTMKSGDMMK